MKASLLFLILFLTNCVSVNQGKGQLAVGYKMEEYGCVDQRGNHTKFLQCNKEYHIKHLTARESILKNGEADLKKQTAMIKIEELMDKKEYKRALSITASIIKNSNDESLVAEAKEKEKRAYAEIQLQEFNKSYPEAKFVLNTGD